MSGSNTDATVLSIAQVLQSVRDGQPAGSITPRVLRNMTASLQALAGVSSIAGKTGAVPLTASDLSDFATAILTALETEAAPSFTTLADTDALMVRSGTAPGWITVSALQKLFSSSGTTPTVQESPEGTAVTTVGPTIVDSAGNIYSLSSGAQVLISGQPDTSKANVAELYYHAPTSGAAKQIYCETSTGGTTAWFTKTTPTAAWTSTTSPLPQPTQTPTSGTPTQVQVAAVNIGASGSYTATFATTPASTNTILLLCASEDNFLLGLGSPWTRIVDGPTADGVRLAAYYGPPSALTNKGFTVTAQHGALYLIETTGVSFEGSSGVGTYNSTTSFSCPPTTETRTNALRYVLMWGYASTNGGSTSVDGSPYNTTAGTLVQSEPGLTGDGFTELVSVPDGYTGAAIGTAAQPVTYIAYVSVNAYTATAAQGGTPASGGPGPSATGTLATIDFGSQTGKFAYGALWGIGTGALVDNNFLLAANANVITALTAIAPRLLRLNCASGVGSTGSSYWTDSIFRNGVSSPDFTAMNQNFMPNAYKYITPNCRLIVGVKFNSSTMIGNPTNYATAVRALVNYFKTTQSGGVLLPLWGIEVGNEDNSSNGGIDIATYCSYFNAAAQAAHAIDPNIQIIGPVDDSLNGGRITSLAQSAGSALGRICYHSYAYCYGLDPTPSDQGLLVATRQGDWAASARSAVAGTAAASAPIFLGEYNQDCMGWSGAQETTQINAVFLAQYQINAFTRVSGVDSGAVWDALQDGPYGVVQSGVITPPGYLLGKAGQTMEGNQVSCTFGGGLSGSPPTTSLAVVNGAKFGVMLVNCSARTGANLPISGTVGLGHWPVNGSGTGTVNRWEISPANPNGATSQLAVTNGVTAPTTVPAQSVVILYP